MRVKQIAALFCLIPMGDFRPSLTITNPASSIRRPLRKVSKPFAGAVANRRKRDELLMITVASNSFRILHTLE